MKKIICVHLYNDYSGSPLVLSTAIKNFVANGLQVEVMTSAQREGFLSGLEGVHYNNFSYRFFGNKVWRALALFWSQCILFFKIIKYRKEDVVIYVNTLLPFGAALAGKATGKKVIYHLHETTVNPPALKSMLRYLANRCATEAVYVSQFLLEEEGLPDVPAKVVYNCLSGDFVQKANQYLSSNAVKEHPFTVLMLCSLKEYKGVHKFIQLAGALPDLRFVMVLNAGEAAIRDYFTGQGIPDNLIIFPSQRDVHSFYREAHLVLNLSHPERWVETFGMTLLEAMSYGLPVIAPPIGGPLELVADGFNGYRVDQREMEVLVEKVWSVFASKNIYQKLSANARAFAATFSEDLFGREMVLAVS